jgi:ribA/ribD-fused uncharacterized protein
VRKVIDSFDGEYQWLSNFQRQSLEYKGLHFKNVEAAFQAQKVIDESQKAKFCNLDPSMAKKLGRTVSLRPDWQKVKDQIMLELIRIKFEDPCYRIKLLATGDSELIEGNWWGDTYWGVCGGIGKNKLGKILMQVREEIREEESLNGQRNAKSS